MRRRSNESRFPWILVVICVMAALIVFLVTRAKGGEGYQYSNETIYKLEKSIHVDVEFDEIWKLLSVEDKRELVIKQITETVKRINDTKNIIFQEKERYPFLGLGVAISPIYFGNHKGIIIVTGIVKGSPAVGKVQLGDIILAVNETRLDDVVINEVGPAKMVKISEAKEEYATKFIDTVKNGDESVRLEINRRDFEISVEVKKALIGVDFPEQLDNLKKKYFSELVKVGFIDIVLKLVNDVETASVQDLKGMFKQAYLLGLDETKRARKEFEEIIYEK